MSNAGATITLAHLELGTVDAVSYQSNWYETTAKRQGGWSLERINPEFGCNPVQAWQESIATGGGTPGRQNSVYLAGAIPNVQIQQVLIQENSLNFVLNIDAESMLSLGSVQVANELPQPLNWTISRDTIRVRFHGELP
ncbi:hypothetical protein M8994_21835, partial [Brucella sp. 21LCYQ03]|nr:hypothetical protein [Brucella sp. 21LCYQ03]